MSRTVISDEIPEETTPVMTFQVVDRDGVGFSPDQFLLTLYDERTGEIINSRDEQDVLDDNGVTIDNDGNVEFQMSEEDTIILTNSRALETHIALFEWRWNGGESVGRHEIQHKIRNLSQVS